MIVLLSIAFFLSTTLGLESEHSHATEESAHPHGKGEEHEESEKAHEEEHEEARSGPRLAVTQASEDSGIQLSAAASRNLGIEVKLAEPVAGGFRIDGGALVRTLGQISVYRLRAGWLRAVEVRLLGGSGGTSPVRIAPTEEGSLAMGDRIVVRGAALLRVAELETWGGSGEGHGH